MRKAKPAARARLRPPSAAAAALCDVIIAALDDHQAEQIAVVDLAGKSSIADFMVIASGRSSRHVIALADALQKLLKVRGEPGRTPEGKARGDWVLIDAGDVVVHLFRPEVRAFYNLEKMWAVELPEPARATDLRR